MAYDIVYAPRALEDLDDIWNYLGVERDNVKAASSAVSAILKRIDLLSDFPESVRHSMLDASSIQIIVLSCQAITLPFIASQTNAFI